MNDAPRRAHWMKPLSLACALFVLFTGTGCEDLDPMGKSIGNNNTRIEVDTLEFGNTETTSIIPYTGFSDYITAGQFDENLFGNIVATAYMKPVLLSPSSSTFNLNSEMKLRLIIDDEAFYGDTTQTAEFDLIEIGELWRAKAWKINDEVSFKNVSTPVASFSVSKQDSIEVDISDAWFGSYRQFYLNDDIDRDTLYRESFHGLAVIPTNSTKLVPFNTSESEFVIYTPDEDTVTIPLQQWAYSLQRSGEQPSPAGSQKVTSTLEHLIEFDLDITREALGSVNISKVELLFYQDNEGLRQSLNEVSAAASRPQPMTASLYLVDPSENPEAVDLGNPIASGEYDTEDKAFRFNITSFANGSLIEGVDEDFRFFVTVGSKNGIIYSSLLHNGQASPDKTPKLIVTSIKTEGISN